MSFRPSLLFAVFLILVADPSPAQQPAVVTSYQFTGNGSFIAWFNGEPGATYRIIASADAGTAGALDGNNATNRVTSIGGDYAPASAITNGGVFHLRWADADNASSDHALAIDDLTITFTFGAP